MGVHALFIISKAGGLVYSQEFVPRETGISANDYLVLLSTFHGLFALSNEVAPRGRETTSGIREFSTAKTKAACLETPTGLKMLLLASLDHKADLQAMLGDVYQLYADYVLKSPLVNPDQPIRAPLFADAVKERLGY
ncbi:sybindin-like protein [Kipferlia bialata]|uniref:Trafficking protein particle complex subunit n=1 Tax=Kipferlia bialata TaxID=797122 RepID=A0A391NNU9_9EUKA|nr:sybindin-like protein [Kipferlia bialata]|eukprot:g905.t1